MNYQKLVEAMRLVVKVEMKKLKAEIVNEMREELTNMLTEMYNVKPSVVKSEVSTRNVPSLMDIVNEDEDEEEMEPRTIFTKSPFSDMLNETANAVIKKSATNGATQQGDPVKRIVERARNANRPQPVVSAPAPVHQPVESGLAVSDKMQLLEKYGMETPQGMGGSNTKAPITESEVVNMTSPEGTPINWGSVDENVVDTLFNKDYSAVMQKLNGKK